MASAGTYSAAMHRYGQFCPIAVACEILAERWTPLVLRELLAGRRHFNELQRGLPLISRSLLAQRLRELEAAGLVERVAKAKGRGYVYRPTPAGTALEPILLQIGEWGRRFVYPRVSRSDLDPALLLWDLHRRLRVDALPARRTVVRFDLRGLPQGAERLRTWWLILERPDVELCLEDPGLDVDLFVGADLFAMTRVWMGEQSLEAALREGRVRLHGPRHLVKAFPNWLLLSVFAHQPGAAEQQA